MRTPRRYHVGTVGGGGRREPSPSLRSVRFREEQHQRDEWDHDQYRRRQSRGSPTREEPFRLSPDLTYRRRRREDDSAFPSSSTSRGFDYAEPVSNAAQSCMERQLVDGDGGCGQGSRSYDRLSPQYTARVHALDRYVDLPRPGRIELYPMADFPVSHAGGLDGREMALPRALRNFEDGLSVTETMVSRNPGYLKDDQVGKEIMISKPLRYLEDERGGKEIATLNLPRYLEDGRGGKEIMAARPSYLQDAPPNPFLGHPIDHNAGDYTASSSLISKGLGGIGVGSVPRVGTMGEEEQHLGFRRQAADEYIGLDQQGLLSSDSSYLGMRPLHSRAVNSSNSRLQEDSNVVDSYQDSLFPAKHFLNVANACDFNREVFEQDESWQVWHLHSVQRPRIGSLVDGQEEGYTDVMRESGSAFFPMSEDFYSQRPWEPHDDYTENANSSHVNPLGIRTDESDTQFRTLKKAYVVENDRISSYHRYHANDISKEYPPGKELIEYRMRRTNSHEFRNAETEYYYDGDDSVLDSYRVRSRNSPVTREFEDIYSKNVSPHRRIVGAHDADVYNLPDDGVLRKRYIVDDEMEGIAHRNGYSSGRRGHDREIDMSDVQWISEERSYGASSERHRGGRHESKLSFHRLSRPTSQFPHHNSVRFFDDGQVNHKRRLKLRPPEFVDNFQTRRKHDLHNHHRYWKKSQDGQDDDKSSNGDFQECHKHVRRDPPEDSEEFQQLVQKAFLRFSKLLNEDPHQRKRYEEQGNGGSLLCCVCGSLSREFVDTHCLVMHAFNSLKVGLRTHHLGLHKALCVMMGWNWLMAPDGAKNYQSRPYSEANALKEDLILWPPLVIVQNISVGMNRNASSSSTIIDKEGLENILRGIGIGAGKARVGLGNPPNPSTMLVKFLPTFSGLQEAERLHKYYVDNNRGRKQYKDLGIGGGSDIKKMAANVGGTGNDVKHLLYGYLAIADDLSELDPDTKRRCVVKSKLEIEAIADAPLTTREANVGI